MAELGLFPLQIVLLPAERVPLHIFEERYQELIGECVEDRLEFGLVFADEEGLRAIGCRASVVEVLERFEDGALNVLVEGGERFRVVRHTSGRSFSTAEVEPVDDEDSRVEPERAERALGAFRRLVQMVDAEVELPAADEPRLSFALAGRVEFEPEAKQELLESVSEPARLDRVAELLEEAVVSVAMAEEAQRRAAGNGKVSHP